MTRHLKGLLFDCLTLTEGLVTPLSSTETILDNYSPSMQYLDKQARLSAFSAPLISESATPNTISTHQAPSTAVQSEIILHLSEVVCFVTFKNQVFIYSIIPQISETQDSQNSCRMYITSSRNHQAQ